MGLREIHRLHYLLDQALYMGFENSKLPDHLKWIQEALMMVKAEIKQREGEYEMGTEMLQENK